MPLRVRESGVVEKQGARRMSISQGPVADPSLSKPVATQPTGRIVALDFIRGIAVLGILFANITAFAHPTLAYYWPGALPGGGTPTDAAIWLIQFVLVDGKLRGLFTLLFGAGMVLFVQRAATQGDGTTLQARRLAWLLVFGLVHFALLFVGDILVSYAVAGFLALPLMRWSARRQIVVGTAWYILCAMALMGLMGSAAAIEANPASRGDPAVAAQWQVMEEGRRQQFASAADAAAVYSGGSYSEVVRYRLTGERRVLAQGIVLVLVETLPLMLLGMGLYRCGLFSGGLDRRRVRRWGWTALLCGAALSAWIGGVALESGLPFHVTQFVFNAAAALPRLPMILGLAGLLSLLASGAERGWLGRRIIAAGRMAFSNYIFTSVLMMLVFHGWAGGLFGALSRINLLGFVFLGWVLMLAWSAPWLARFRYGPLEWLWRCLTFGQRFPLRH